MRPRALCLAAVALWFASAARAAGAPDAGALFHQLDAAFAEARRLGAREETALRRDGAAHAADLHRIEHRVIGLHQLAAEAHFPTEGSRERFRGEARALLGAVYAMQGRTLDEAVARLNAALPGADGARLVRAYRGEDVYQPNYRSSRRLRPAERRARLDAQRREFAERGGRRGDVRPLDQAMIARVASGDLVEWVKVGRRLRATTSGANHPVMAGGRSVRGAGGLKLWKDPSGEVSLAVVSNWSGNYKPGPGAALSLADHLARMGVRRDRIMLTQSTPDSAIVAGLFLKAGGLAKDRVKARQKRIEKLGARDLVRIRAGARPPRLGRIRR